MWSDITSYVMMVLQVRWFNLLFMSVGISVDEYLLCEHSFFSSWKNELRIRSVLYMA